ncbi:bacillithiol biosynthesis deacetylase BshB1 [Shouchella shacheensis]|uniref:bacillithiol biosynthesis deacetylase BshB1 n=1 Tax=Shouchella shacheensis TaxID=1649580 RepID=UPI000A6D74D5|nr:bacillithiol biosynthesis deacetylase BshB1 [Shouchella shacheensis]
MNLQQLDILAFGAHPDDVEIGMAGTLATYVNDGYRVGLCALTKAELSSNGSVEARQKEAERAAEAIGASRFQFSFSDRGLPSVTPNELAQVVALIRKTRPRLVFAPEGDRHPDHGECGELVREAVFNAGIRRYQTPESEVAHKPEALFTYFINGYGRPDFVVDITKVQDKKREALQAYKSQFQPIEGVSTPLTDDYIEAVEARDKLFGKEVGVAAAEGFCSRLPLLMGNLLERND